VEGQSASAIAERDQQRDILLPKSMMEELKKNPKNERALFHFALWYQTKKDFRKTLKYGNLFLKYSVSAPDRYFILFNRAIMFLERGKSFRAFWAISRAGLAEPNRWETEKVKGLIFFSRGKFEKALPFFVNSFNQNQVNFAYKPMERDDAGTWNLIGECFYNRAIFDKASTAFGLASERAITKDKKDYFKRRQQLMVNMLIGRKN
jgi:tetratricopeptide (TPR) repeat protein